MSKGTKKKERHQRSLERKRLIAAWRAEYNRRVELDKQQDHSWCPGLGGLIPIDLFGTTGSIGGKSRA